MPAFVYYGDENAAKYHMSSRIQEIQKQMTRRAIELLALPAGEQCLLLDLGAGTGLAGEVLQQGGHTWVGTDIAMPMLRIAKRREFVAAAERHDGGDDDEAEWEESGEESDSDDDGVASDDGDDDDDDEEEEGDDDAEDAAETEAAARTAGHRGRRARAEVEEQNPLEGRPQPVEVMQHDMGTCIPFRPGVFDGAISISALQWLCNIDRRGQVPQRRLKDFFQSLFNSLRRGARAVLQFYPSNTAQTAMISTIATRCGFGGGVIVDFPHSTRARKHYLVIYAGLATAGYQPPRPLGEGENEEAYNSDDVDGDSDDDADQDGAGDSKGQVRVFPRERRRNARMTGQPEGRGRTRRPKKGTKEWVLMKKDQRRKFGEETRPDSKYTARKRPRRF